MSVYAWLRPARFSPNMVSYQYARSDKKDLRNMICKIDVIECSTGTKLEKQNNSN